MQIPFIHYLHHTSKFCAGYDKYLSKRKLGKNIVFNWYFFFFNFFWLSYHRMYKEFSIALYLYVLVLMYTAKGFLTPQSAGTFIFIGYFMGCFYSYYFYERAFNEKIQLNKEDPYKKIRPYNFFISLIIFSFLAIINVVVFSKIFILFI